MSQFRDRAGSRSGELVVVDIIDGRPWIAHHIQINNVRQHCHLLASTFRSPHPLTVPLAPAARRLFRHIALATDLLTAVHPKQLQVVPALVRMAAYHSGWKRHPEEWVPDSTLEPRLLLYDLANHLFARWPMPQWFGSAWLVKGDLFYLERDWFCRVGAGESMRKLTGMPPSITSRALALSLGAPGNLTVREALRWGQVTAMGGSRELLAEVMKSRMVKDLSNDAVWCRLMEKMVAAGVRHIRHFGLISDMLVEVMRIDGWQRGEELVGLPLKELLRHSRRFWRAVFASGTEALPEMRNLRISCPHARAQVGAMAAARWARLPFVRNFQVTREDKWLGFTVWSVVELTSLAQLVAETRALRHCVSCYGRRCLSGRSSIFRMRVRCAVTGEMCGDGNLTIEVDRHTRRVIQVRGLFNRLPNSAEIRMVRTWAAESRLAA